MIKTKPTDIKKAKEFIEKKYPKIRVFSKHTISNIMAEYVEYLEKKKSEEIRNYIHSQGTDTSTRV